MSIEPKLIAGASRPAHHSYVEVQLDEEMIDEAADIATSIIMHNFGSALGVTRQQVKDINVVGLKAALLCAAGDYDIIPKGMKIPVYFSSMIRGLDIKIGREVVEVHSSDVEVSLPEGYKQVVRELKALGVGFINPHSPTLDFSDTLAYGKESIDDVVCITGLKDSAQLEDLVRRGFYDMLEGDFETMRRITGQLPYNYGELEELLVDYYASHVKTALT